MSFFIHPLFFCTKTEKYSVIVSQKKWSVNGKSQAFSRFSTISHTNFVSQKNQENAHNSMPFEYDNYNRQGGVFF
jgi:hypothetical protein